jgi:hypothetical protein
VPFLLTSSWQCGDPSQGTGSQLQCTLFLSPAILHLYQNLKKISVFVKLIMVILKTINAQRYFVVTLHKGDRNEDATYSSISTYFAVVHSLKGGLGAW